MGGLAKRLGPKRLRRTLGAASCVRERARFVGRELRDAPVVGRYRLRESGLTVHVRHPVLDMWVLEEIFRFRTYEPPPEARRAMAALGAAPRVLDLGGHVGLFGLFIRTLFPEAQVVSFEPDPDNGALLSRTIEANGLEDRWTLVEACAGTRDGTAQFASSGHLSRVQADEDRALEDIHRRISAAFGFLRDSALLQPHRLEVEVRDAFPDLRNADLVKIDIEGGEWELLADRRFAGLEAAAVVLEYHPTYGPGDDAEAVLTDALTDAGFTPGAPQRGPETGLLWAWRS